MNKKIKAVIMVAGKSTRTYPLTIETPKPLLKVVDKTIIEHNLNQIIGIVDEVFIIVGFMKEKIMSYLGNEYKGIKINYVEQKEQLGTGHALLQCKEKIDGKFIVMNGDDLYSSVDIKKLADIDKGALAKKVEDWRRFGIYKVQDGKMVDLIEKPNEFIGDLANIGCYIFDKSIFSILENVKKSKRGEIEITSGIKQLDDFKIIKIKDYWIPIGYPWNYLEANVEMMKRVKFSINGEVEKGAVIKGDVFIGKSSIVKSGSYIEGPVYIGRGCVIGPGAYIRKDSIIMDNVNTRAEIYDSVLMDNATAKHNCYIGHSVIGERVNIGAGTITSDYRHDGKNHITVVKEDKIDTGRRKLGAFLGNNVKTGIGTLIYPGRKLCPRIGTLPGEIVKKDKME